MLYLLRACSIATLLASTIAMRVNGARNKATATWWGMDAQKCVESCGLDDYAKCKQRLTFKVRSKCCNSAQLVTSSDVKAMCLWEFSKEAEVANVEGLATEALPQPFKELLPGGQMSAALELASNWGVMHCHKQRATGLFTFDEPNCKVGMVADLTLPVGVGRTKIVDFKLLWRTPQSVKESSAFIWEGLGTLFVCFGQLRADYGVGSHALKMWWNMSTVVPMALADGHSINLQKVVKYKVDKLWFKHGFEKAFKEILQNPDFQTHRLLFNGISYGGVLAKATSIRFKAEAEAEDRHVQTVTWNSFRWTDEAGVKLFSERFGNDFLQFQLSRPRSDSLREWDVLAAWPPAMAKDPNLKLLDQATGAIMPCEGSCPGKVGLGITWARLMGSLHSHRKVIPAMHQATMNAFSVTPDSR